MSGLKSPPPLLLLLLLHIPPIGSLSAMPSLLAAMRERQKMEEKTHTEKENKAKAAKLAEKARQKHERKVKTNNQRKATRAQRFLRRAARME